MAEPYVMRMRMFGKTVLTASLAAIALAVGAPLLARDGQDSGQAAATERRKAGQNLPAREIERRVIPSVPGARYLGFEYIAEMNIYRLKFLRNGSVIWVDADGRTGRIVRRTGN
jgi:hypothetical protein